MGIVIAVFLLMTIARVIRWSAARRNGSTTAFGHQSRREAWESRLRQSANLTRTA